MHPQFLKGRLAQLVQSIWFTPRGSGVRIPHRPQPKSRTHSVWLFCLNPLEIYFHKERNKKGMNEQSEFGFEVGYQGQFTGITVGNPTIDKKGMNEQSEFGFEVGYQGQFTGITVGNPTRNKKAKLFKVIMGLNLIQSQHAFFKIFIGRVVA